MSIHRSLRGVDTLVGERSVLTRIERLNKLQKDGRIETDKRSPYGLPKVRTKFKVAGKKKAEKPAGGAAGAPGAPGATGAPGAAGATPAAGAAPAAAATEAKGKSAAKGKK